MLVTLAATAAWAAGQAGQLGSSPAPEGTVLPGDWGPELLDGMLSSPNPQAGEELYRAAFAAGPAIIPQLQAALKDDRTASFAAQSLAFIGGEKALDILAGLVDDPRNLDLRRFYYGTLGEFDDPRASDTLLRVIGHSDQEPDRTVTEAAIIALTVHTDPALLPKLRAVEKLVKDVVIQDDIENAADVIEARARYMATPAGKKESGSMDQVVRTYFIPALEGPPGAASGLASNRRASKAPPVEVHIQNLTFSPDKNRALAHVIFETPDALANYEMVIQKKFGNWTLASVWLGAEMEKASAKPPAPHRKSKP